MKKSRFLFLILIAAILWLEWFGMGRLNRWLDVFSPHKAQAADSINRGLFKGYMNLQFNSQGNFKKYALLFTSLPLIPPSIVKKIINSAKWMNFLERLPTIFVLIAKFIINIRAGTGFIFFTVLRNEWFYLRNTVYQKWVLRQGLGKFLN